MSWHPNDLVTDADLRDYEEAVSTRFGQTTWLSKRTKALEDWLFPILKSQGFDPHRLRTRFEPASVLAFTASAYSDKTGASKDTAADDLNLATIFATAGTDALYIGSTVPFRGLFVRMLDSVSAIASVLSVAYWNGTWEALTVADGTMQAAGKTFSGGGSVTWLLPMDWATRVVNGSTPYYWVKVTVSATPTSAKAGQLAVLRASALRAPAALRTLQLIFQEAPTGADGPWEQKADFYKGEADLALQRALAIVGGEFDTDTNDVISVEEAAQTAETAGGGYALERA